MKLAPRITLRQLLIFMAGVAVFMAVVSLAVRGNAVAFGMAVSLAGLAAVFLCYAVAYWILIVYAATVTSRQSEKFQVSAPPQRPEQDPAA